jgi:tRNA pseudouridine38-40 synthase
VTELTVTREQEEIVISCSGNGFLRHMVRNIVGTLVEVGRGARLPADIKHVLDGRDRRLAGPTAPPHGLYLVRVLYP